MSRRETVENWARTWLGDRPEYTAMIEAGTLPVDQCTEAALPDMPVRYQDVARRTRLRAAFAKVAQQHGFRAIARVEGQTIYGFVRDLDTLFDLEQYLRPLVLEVRGRDAAIVLLIQEWLDSHPSEASSVDEVLDGIRAEIAA